MSALGSGATAPTTAPTRAARPLLALAGALAMPGLGHLYLGDPVRGAMFLVAVALAVPGAARLGLAAPLHLLWLVLMLGVAAAVGIYAWSVVDAFRRGRRSPVVLTSAWTRRLGVCALYVAGGYAWVLAPSTGYVRESLVETFVVPSRSMMPTVLPGDRILADKRVGRRGGVKLWRGALAIFIFPNDRTSVFIKRVIGLPGDRIDIDGHTLRVNGKDVSLPDAHTPAAAEDTEGDAPTRLRTAREHGDRGEYDVLWPTADAPRTGAGTAVTTSSLVVPDGQVFVLGDNRAAAFDSRRFGTVPIADIEAIARQVWFSSARDDGVRWGRIGFWLH